jgi:ribosomal-protein-serine acetyltransferase
MHIKCTLGDKKKQQSYSTTEQTCKQDKTLKDSGFKMIHGQNWRDNLEEKSSEMSLSLMRRKALTDRKTPNITIEKINPERTGEFYTAVVESSNVWFAEGMLPKPDLTAEELDALVKSLLDLWEQDDFYMFFVTDATTREIVGVTFLNHVNRMYQMANLGYAVRPSRTREGIATQAAKLAAQYGFEKLGLQRIEIVVDKDNLPSLKVAEKVGAVREGLLRNRLQLHGSPRDAYMHSLIPTDDLKQP